MHDKLCFKLHDILFTCSIYITGTGVQQETGAELNVLLQCNGGTENLVNVAKFPMDDDNCSLLVVFHDYVCDGQNSIHVVRSWHRFIRPPIATHSPGTLFTN